MAELTMPKGTTMQNGQIVEQTTGVAPVNQTGTPDVKTSAEGAANLNAAYAAHAGDATYGPATGTPQKAGSDLEAAQAAQYATKTPEQVAEESRAAQIKSAQSRISDIQSKYGEQLKSELALQAPVNENAIGRTNALSSLMGLSGSATATTRSNVAEQAAANVNRSITSKVNTEMMDRINSIYDKIDENAQRMAEAQVQTNKENQQRLINDAKNNALSTVQALASTISQTGKTFDDWKKADNGEALNKIMQQTGQSEYQIRSAWNNAIPEAYKPTVHTSYVDDGKGGTIMRQVEFNPITKKAESHDYNLAVPVSTFNGDVKPIEGKNGELFVKQADGSYKDVSPNAENNAAIAKANLEKQQSDIAYQKSQTAKNWQDIAKIRADLNGTTDPAVTTVKGQNIIAGVTVDPKIASDVQQVLEGRNTLYNIRQTMGRTNAAAAYMKEMRDTISKIDPKFDFVASDAGGKFVSSGYYQKSLAAIDSVMPNIDKVVDLSNEVNRIGVKGVDNLIQKYGLQIGDKKVSNFIEAQKLISDEIGLALGQGSVSDMKLQLGFDVTDPSVKPEVFASNMGLVKDFIQNRKDGLNQQRYSSSTVNSTNNQNSQKVNIGGTNYNIGQTLTNGNLTLTVNADGTLEGSDGNKYDTNGNIIK